MARRLERVCRTPAGVGASCIHPERRRVGYADPEVLRGWRFLGYGGVRHHREKQLHIGDGPAQGRDDRQPGRVSDLAGHAVWGGAKAHDSTARGGDPDRTAHVSAHRHRGHAGGHGCRAAPAGAARGDAGSPWVVGGREDGIGRPDRRRQLGEVGLPEDGGPGRPGSRYRGRVRVGNPVAPHRAPVCPRHARHRQVVLHRQRHAGHRAGPSPRVPIDVHVRVNSRIQPVDGGQVRPHHCLGVVGHLIPQLSFRPASLTPRIQRA